MLRALKSWRSRRELSIHYFAEDHQVVGAISKAFARDVRALTRDGVAVDVADAWLVQVVVVVLEAASKVEQLADGDLLSELISLPLGDRLADFLF